MEYGWMQLLSSMACQDIKISIHCTFIYVVTMIKLKLRIGLTWMILSMKAVRTWCIYNAYRITGHLWRNKLVTGKFPSGRPSSVELWWFHCYWPEYAVEKTVELPMTWAIMTIILRESNSYTVCCHNSIAGFQIATIFHMPTQYSCHNVRKIL